MTKLQAILYSLINWSEVLTAIIAILYYRQLKNSYWKWFVIYIVFMAVFDIFGDLGLDNFPNFRKTFYGFFVIPLEFLFLFWLYARKSLLMNKLHYISVFVYLSFLIPHFFYISNTRIVNQLSYTVGCLLLFIMCVLEFIKQIKSDDILNFKANKMFYINIGVILFYIGTMPFFTFDKFLYENQRDIWNNYKLFFLFSVNIMYLLFTASFIWGKPKT